MATLAEYKQVERLMDSFSLEQLKSIRSFADACTWALRPNKNPHAASKIIVVPELLEEILMNLSFEEIFVCMRVDQTFKKTIDDSPKLSAKSFLRQTGEMVVQATFEFSSKVRMLPICNPLIDLVLEDLGFSLEDANYLGDDPDLEPHEWPRNVLELCYASDIEMLPRPRGYAIENRPGSFQGGQKAFTGVKDGKQGSWAGT